MDSDKRLSPPMVVYDVAEISGERRWTASRDGDYSERKRTSDTSMSSYTRPGVYG